MIYTTFCFSTACKGLPVIADKLFQQQDLKLYYGNNLCRFRKTENVSRCNVAQTRNQVNFVLDEHSCESGVLWVNTFYCADNYLCGKSGILCLLWVAELLSRQSGCEVYAHSSYPLKQEGPFFVLLMYENGWADGTSLHLHQHRGAYIYLM